MDPSYTNSVGATNPGGTNPGNLNAQNTNPNAQVLQGGQQNPAQPVVPQQPMQPTTMQQPAISFGTGDVVIGGGNAASSKKSRKGVVILIILVVLLALVSGGFLLWQNGVFGGNGGENVQTSQMTDLQKSYNSYVNYVLWGVESDGKPDYDAMEQARPYFEGLSGSELIEYVSMANEKYNKLSNAYNASTSENKINLEPMKLYFEDFASVGEINQDEILTSYLASGEQKTEELIERTYNSGESKLGDLLSEKRKLAKTILDITAKTVVANCVKDEKITPGCYQLTGEEKQALSETTTKMIEAENDLMEKAMGAITDLYNGTYDKNEAVSGGVE